MDEKHDIELFTNIYDNYKEKYIRFAHSYVHDRSVAEDLVSESMIYYWENRKKLQTVKDIPLYILVTLKNKCLDYLRREQKWGEISDELMSDEQWELNIRIQNLQACDPSVLLNREVQELIDKALSQLPYKSRRIFIMNRYDGKNYKAIAEETGLSVKSVEFHMSKVLKVLRNELKDYLPIFLLVLSVLLDDAHKRA